jgi:hypothetical protein
VNIQQTAVDARDSVASSRNGSDKINFLFVVRPIDVMHTSRRAINVLMGGSRQGNLVRGRPSKGTATMLYTLQVNPVASSQGVTLG